MIMKKGFDVFVAIFVIISSKVCMSCFTEDQYEKHIDKTGTTYVKSCQCSEIGYSVDYLTWLDPSGAEIVSNGLDTNHNVYMEIDRENGTKTLIVRSISKTMSGNYTCRTNFEGNTHNRTYNIEAYDSPYFVNTSTNQYIIMGENSLVRCDVRSTVEYVTDWYRLTDFEAILLNNDTKYSILHGRGLVINNVSKDDGGRYDCTVTDSVESFPKSITINIEVAARPKIIDLKLNIPAENVVAGDNLTVECVAEGKPYPVYSWIKIKDWLGNPIKDGNATWTQEVNAMKFESIQKEDAGTYVCIASNDVDNASKEIIIYVTVPPTITSFNNTETVEGGPAQIVCEANGVPVPKVYVGTSVEGLDNDNRVVKDEKNTSDTSRLNLSIYNVSRTFQGVYTCIAVCRDYNVTQEMYLNVYYPPQFPQPNETVWGWNGYAVNMSCDHTSNPPATILWKFIGEEGTTTAENVQVNKLLQELSVDNMRNYLALPVDNSSMYGEYQCIASNGHGNATKKIYLREASKPGIINNATILDSTASSVTFLIQGPNNTDNAPVNGYLAEYDLVENYLITSVHPTMGCDLSRNFTVDRLKPNSTYSIRFAAQNVVGNGDWSDPVEFMTPESSAPQQPISVRSNQGKLRWEAPEANGDPIDHYSIEYCPIIGKVINYTLCQNEKVSATEFLLDKLTRNTKYKFEVRAHNSHGYSDFTSEEITTPEKLVKAGLLSASTIIGLSVVVVFLCLLLLDLLLLCWRRQGIIASCYFRKNKKKDKNLNSRDKKGLLVNDGERTDDRANNGHRELVYNKTTGVITGKHSTV